MNQLNIFYKFLLSSRCKKELALFHGSITPLSRDNSLFPIIKSGSNFSKYPRPSHPLHAPLGLLNENNLGSISSIVKPETGQENFDEKI